MSNRVSNQLVFTPRDLTDATQFLADHRDENWRPVAGGTSVMWKLYHGGTTTTGWIDLSLLRDQLASIRVEGNRIRVGALTTMTQLGESTLLRDACPLIQQAATAAGSVQLRNRATVGGRVVSNSPAAECAPAWLALDAEIELTSLESSRCLPYHQFVTGYRQTAIAPNELLTAVFLPLPERPIQRLLFRKVAARSAVTIGKVIIAATASLDAEGCYRQVRLSFGGMGPVPLRAREAERLVEGNPLSDSLGEKAANALTRDLTPIDDHRSTAEYRLRVAGNLTHAFVAGHIGVEATTT